MEVSDMSKHAVGHERRRTRSEAVTVRWSYADGVAEDEVLPPTLPRPRPRLRPRPVRPAFPSCRPPISSTLVSPNPLGQPRALFVLAKPARRLAFAPVTERTPMRHAPIARAVPTLVVPTPGPTARRRDVRAESTAAWLSLALPLAIAALLMVAGAALGAHLGSRLGAVVWSGSDHPQEAR